jgi:hypothetical protein
VRVAVAVVIIARHDVKRRVATRRPSSHGDARARGVASERIARTARRALDVAREPRREIVERRANRRESREATVTDETTTRGVARRRRRCCCVVESLCF